MTRRVKIIGAGSIGNHLAQACRRMGWNVCLCDVDLKALKRTRESIYPGRYGQWDDVIELYSLADCPKGGFDLIFLGIPPDVRVRLALEALEEQPKLLQLEKPVCPPSFEGAQELFEKASKSRTHVCVGYDHVLGENTKRVEALLAEESVGRIETIDVEFREHWGGIFTAHPWLTGPEETYLGHWKRGGGASGEHSHATNLWQHFAHQLGVGRITEVNASLEFVKKGTADYDRIACLNVKTEKGLFGRIIQDVVTRPPRKWAKIQGEKGYIEWHCGWEPGKDAVFLQREGEPRGETLIPKKRPDDFYREMQHFDQLLQGKLDPQQSPVSLERGLDTALVIAAAHQSHREHRTIRIDYKKGYKLAALS